MKLGVVLETWKILPRYWRTFVRGSFIGSGWLQAGRATPASFMSYAFAKRFSKNADRFGKASWRAWWRRRRPPTPRRGRMLPMITLASRLPRRR